MDGGSQDTDAETSDSTRGVRQEVFNGEMVCKAAAFLAPSDHTLISQRGKLGIRQPKQAAEDFLVVGAAVGAGPSGGAGGGGEMRGESGDAQGLAVNFDGTVWRN